MGNLPYMPFEQECSPEVAKIEEMQKLKDALHKVLEAGNDLEVSELIQNISKNKNYSPKEKKELLMAKNSRNIPGLCKALFKAKHKAVSAYMKAVLSLDVIDIATKEELLAAKNAAGDPGLAMALLHGDKDTVNVYITCVLESTFSLSAKKALLAAQDAQGIHAFYLAVANGRTETGEAYASSILTFDPLKLSSGIKTELVVPKDKKGRSWFEKAWEHKNLSFIHDYAEILFRNGLRLSKQHNALLRTAAGVIFKSISKEEDITWSTVHWIGMAYVPGSLFHKSAHMIMATKMKTQVPIEGKTAIQYLQEVYTSLSSKKTKIAKYIRLVFHQAKVPLILGQTQGSGATDFAFFKPDGDNQSTWSYDSVPETNPF